MPLKPNEMEKVILEDGWVFCGQKGSHRQYKHANKKGKVTIPFHKGKDINPITEKVYENKLGLSNLLKKRGWIV